jgi:SNF family Na+-dependent transporter
VEFLLLLISNCVGPDNVWRFLYLVVKTGGGLIQIFLHSLKCLSHSFISLFLFQCVADDESVCCSRVGITMIINSVLDTLYYHVIIAWFLFYFVLSMFPLIELCQLVEIKCDSVSYQKSRQVIVEKDKWLLKY